MPKYLQVDRFYIAAYQPADGGDKVNIEKVSGAFPNPKERYKDWRTNKMVPPKIREDWTSYDINWEKLAGWYAKNLPGKRAVGMVIALIEGGKIRYRGKSKDE